ncbi:MAG: preprotein translocase subunit SecY [Salinisphaeraceae bacterium]|uniref:Protein translocase subunit SecY n=2 Tax=Spectribacter TaxID=3160928 RepID=A0ABU3C3I8_9GAMM|nr:MULTISPECIES: preprotein translocase subunit SecY [unclassified Salinisphaera]MDT0619370.1 preprotein translocase subunit SecY [Salinisphaera sp. P385]MDT0636123.1 preprotein translocase subunit SecY [Salinisphaera sp. W335]
MMPDAGKLTEVRQRLLFLLGALIVFRIGSFIPVPGIDPAQLAQMFERQSGTILDLGVMFTGGALERLSILALGVMPYISASIIMQLMTATVPSLKEKKKEGEAGRRQITQYTRYGTLGLASFQSIGTGIALWNQGIALDGVTQYSFIFTTAICLTTGALFLMWLGEQVTERGIGNGISILIFASIVSGLPSAIGGTMDLVRTGELNALTAVVLFIGALAVLGFVVFMERAQRRIPVHHAQRQRGRKMYGSQTQHLPLKLNMAGVIPPIFASSIILFPATIVRFLGEGGTIGNWVANAISPGQPLYVLLYSLMIIFFCFFYTALVFDSRETADNLKRSGAFIPGVRPGVQTANYIDTVLTRLTVAGAAYITAVCLLPEFLILQWNVPFYFGGTSLLIIVVVVMDFMSQLQAHLMSHQYEGLLKKANLKGHGGAGMLR